MDQSLIEISNVGSKAAWMITVGNVLHQAAVVTVVSTVITMTSSTAHAKVHTIHSMDATDDTCCLACPDPNCINCNGSQNSCVKCVEGFYVGRLSSGKVGCVGTHTPHAIPSNPPFCFLECGKSVDHCETCSRDGGDCYSCATGFYLEHGHCISNAF